MPEPEVVRAIQESSRSLNKSLESVKADTRKSQNLPEKILEFFTTFQRTIEDAVHRLLENQGMMLLISKSSELESYRDLIGEQQAALEQKKQYLVNDLAKLRQRYSRLNDELSESTQATIQKLDGHVINLSYECYETGPGKAYSEYAAPLADAGERYWLDCSLYRADSVEEKATGAADTIDQFLYARSAFIDEVSHYVEKDAPAEPRSYPLPVFLVERRDTDNPVLLGPGQMNFVGNRTEYIPDDGPKSVTASLQRNAARMTNGLNYRSLSNEERETWTQMVDELFDRGTLRDTGRISLRTAIKDLIGRTDLQLGERDNE